MQRDRLTAWRRPRELAVLIAVLALPVAATNALQILLGYVDTRMLSPLGGPALSAMSVGRAGTMLMMALFMGLGVGITAYVARLTGAGRHPEARRYAAAGILTGAVLGLLLTIAGLWLAKGPVQMMVTAGGPGADLHSMEVARRYAWDFMRVLFVSMAGVGVMVSAVSVFNSLGRTLYPMWLLLLANLANFVGNVLFIPRFEVFGSSVSTAITTLITASVAVVTLTRLGALAWNLDGVLAALARAWARLKVGLPATVQMALRTLSMLTLIKMITLLPNSVSGQGALHVGLQAESLAFMPAFAFSTAAAALIGQHLGARQPHRARTAALFCLGGSQLVMWTMGSLLFIFPGWFVGLFIGHNAPEVMPVAVGFLRVLALCLPGLGLSMTMMGVLRGSGDTLITAVISFIAMYGVRLPLAAFLALSGLGSAHLGLGWGLNGIWWAMTLSVYVEAGLAYLRFASGRWARIELAGEEPTAATGAGRGRLAAREAMALGDLGDES